MYIIAIIILVIYCVIGGPILCITLSALRVREQDYGIATGDARKANLKPALNIFYFTSLAHGAICLSLLLIEGCGDAICLYSLSHKTGLSPKVLSGYLNKTRQMCANNLASTVSWNLITYGASLLDSSLVEDYAAGGRVLTTLVDQDVPLQIRRMMIRAPQRIQKLIGTLAWRSQEEQEMRWVATRILEHLACDLNLVQFSGALECISCLFDTSCHSSADREARHSPFVTELSKPPEDEDGLLKVLQRVFNNHVRVCREWIRRTDSAPENGVSLEDQSNQKDDDNEEVDKDLVLPGLRILENLAHDGQNSTLIYNTKDLLSKIVAPISFRELQEDIKSNSTAWIKVVDGSLKVVIRLMGSPGSTGTEMGGSIANNSTALKNLNAVLDMDTERNRSIMELQMRAIEVLTQLALHHSEILARDHKEIFPKGNGGIIERALDIFLTTDWMGAYLQVVQRRIEIGTPSHVKKKKMKKAKETTSRLKEKAGEALAMLSSDPEVIKSFKIELFREDHVRHLTELLDSTNRTIGDTDDPVQIGINICCRISAAVILKNLRDHDMDLRDHDMKLTLQKVLISAGLLHALPAIPAIPVNRVENDSPPRAGVYHACCSRMASFGNDIENHANSCITSVRNKMNQLTTYCIRAFRNNTANPSDGGQDESRSHHIQQCEERRLHADLISLIRVSLEKSNFDFAAILILQPHMSPVSLLGEFLVRLKKMVDDNMYATPACLDIQEHACEIVTGLLQHNENVVLINSQNIIVTLLKASKVMARFESSMLFAGLPHDCHGVLLKPLSSVLAKQAEDLLTHRRQALGINTAPAGAPPP